MTSNRITITMSETGAGSAPQARKIFNPLDVACAAAVDEDQSLESTSAIINEEVGVCPKCKKQMGTAIIANNDTVYYCETDRVSTPLPDTGA